MKPEIIVALDGYTDSVFALRAAREIDADWYKIGLDLLFDGGSQTLVDYIHDSGKKLFLDVKLADIATTNIRAMHALIRACTPHIMSIRTYAYDCQKAAGDMTLIAEVRNITSTTIREDYIPMTSAVVCHPSMASDFRKKSSGLTIICPGIRLSNFRNDVDDHSEPATEPPMDANYLVIDRPIVKSKDPWQTYRAMKDVINGASA